MKAWLREWLQNNAKKSDALVLQHVTASGGVAVLLTVDIAPGDIQNAAWVDVTLSSLEDAAQSHVETFNTRSGVHRFIVSLQTQGRQTAQRGFNGEQNRDASGVGVDSEPATATGVLAQVMRHLERREISNAQTLQAALGAVEAMSTQLASQRSHEGILQGQIMDMFGVLQRLHKIEATKTLDEKNADRKAAQIDRIIGHLGRLVPVALENLSGTGVVAELVESLDEDQQEALIAAAKPNVRKKLAKVLRQQKQYDREKEAPDDPSPASPASTSNGASNGAHKNGAPS